MFPMKRLKLALGDIDPARPARKSHALGASSLAT